MAEPSRRRSLHRPDPADHAARRAIVEGTDRTCFVEAGAGTGKTSVLVERIVTVVLEDRVPLRSVAAITFTERAAAELRDRIRREFSRRAGDTSLDDATRARCREALDEADLAAITTLHGFAQRLLLAHPVEAGLPPSLEVLDEIASSVEFDRRWSAFRHTLLDDPTWSRSVLLADELGVSLDALGELARELDANWDLVEEHGEALAGPPPRPVPAERLADAAETLAALACSVVPDDKLAAQLLELRHWAAAARTLTDDTDRLAHLAGFPAVKGNVGTKANWKHAPCDVAEARERARSLAGEVAAAVESVGNEVAAHLGGAVARFVLDAADARRREGRLAFHDLLVLARRVLRDRTHGPAVRASAHATWSRLFVDEFQDTDPVQLDLALLVTAPPEATGSRWDELEPVPGRLVLVGDPKQSIYRFRRADVRLVRRAAERFAGHRHELSSNFRTVAPVIEWVNHVFAVLMAHGDDQVPYAPLHAEVHVEGGAGGDHRVRLLGVEEHTDGPRADELRRREATDVVDAVRTLLATGAPVRDGTEPDGTVRWRPCRPSDIAVLLPARTSLAALDEAFASAGIPTRAESSSFVYTARDVRDVMLALRALDDPTDGHTLVAALRTPWFACSDLALLEFAAAGGRFDHQLEPPGSLPADHPVVEALAWLREAHHHRAWLAPSAVLDRLVRERRVLEVAALGPRPRERIRRIRFLLDQCRAWCEARPSGTLREYLRWVEGQSRNGARAVETILPEHDDEAVRILTVHASKGLEFPIVVVSGATTRPNGRTARAEVLWTGTTPQLRLRNVRTEGFDEVQPIDEQLSLDERVRLLYVACTRARDHLVVSLHRTARAQGLPPDRHRWTNAELLASAALDADGAPDGAATPATGGPLTAPPAAAPAGATPEPSAGRPLPDDLEQWEQRRAAAIAVAARRGSVGASRLAHPPDTAPLDDGEGVDDPEADPGTVKGPRDLESPPWNRGRYGTAVGRAVHGVLQVVDLAGGPDQPELSTLCRSQAVAEGVADRAALVEQLVASALTHPVVLDAAGRPHWRETYVAAPVDGVLVEGYVDLLVDDGQGGLVVVDHKTDQPADDAEREAAVGRYARQLAAYALVLTAATGRPVRRGVLLFLAAGSPARAVELDRDDLARAAHEVRASLPDHAAPAPAAW